MWGLVSLLERLFKLRAHGTDVRTELVAGLTTFMTMSFIIIVNPAIVSDTGMPFDAVLMATCLASAVSCFLMAFLTNYPFALAPGMGLNAYFAYSVVEGMGVPWQAALGAVFLSGLVFFVLTTLKIREELFNAIPDAIRYGIGAGIGGFIALIGMQNAGIVVAHPGTALALGDLRSPESALAAVGVVLTAWLLARRVTGAILWGILLLTAAAVPLGIAPLPTKIWQVPSFSTWEPVLGKLDILGALGLGFTTVVLGLVFTELFGILGFLTGVALTGGFLDEGGRLPRGRNVMLVDSTGTMLGAVFGTPTITTYVESVTGVVAGGRTGLVAVVVGLCFLVAPFFGPLVALVPAAATAPALIIVGALMVGTVARIRWDDYTESVPAFLAFVGMPFTYSIADGIAMALIAYVALKLLSGEGRRIPWFLYVVVALFILKYALGA